MVVLHHLPAQAIAELKKVVVSVLFAGTEAFSSEVPVSEWPS